MDVFTLLGTIIIENELARRALQEVSQDGNRTESKLSGAFGKIGKAAAAVGKAVGAGMIAAGTAVAGLVTKSIQSYADYEQLVGGVDTLFKESSQKVQDYAQNAYKTAGMSADEYMETVTSFSASLLQSLDGDTNAAAEKANMAITDMSDNANKMGTSMEMIQNAYNGFAKANYTMLDNLKLGYGGTKEEMQRLLDDAQAISGIEYDISSYGDVVDAIHVIQNEMGITGTTAKEASSTISGSIASMKASWGNLLTAISDENADFEGYVNAFVDSVSTVADNLLPRIEIALNGVVMLINKLAPTIIGRVPELLLQLLPAVVEAATSIINALVEILPGVVSAITGMLPAIVQGFEAIINGLLNALPAIVQALLDALPEIIPLLINALESMFITLTTVLPQIIQPIIEAIPTLAEQIVNCLLDMLPGLMQGIMSLITALVEMLPQVLPLIIQGVIDIVTMIIDYLPLIVPDLVNAVIQIIMLLVENLPQMIPMLIEAVIMIVQLLVEQLPIIIPMLLDSTMQLAQAIIDNLPVILLAILTAVTTSLPAVLQAVWDVIVMAFESIPEWFGQIFTMAVTLIKEAFGMLNEVISGVLTIIKDLFAPIAAWIDENVIQPIVNFFKSLGEDVAAVWNTICDYIEFAISIIGFIIDAAVQLITLPFRFIWENCKEYVFAAFEWIKEKISAAVNWIRDKVKAGFGLIKTYIIQPITDAKNKAVEIFENIKTSIQQKINSVKAKVKEAFDSIKKRIVTPVNEAKTTVTSTFESIKSNISSKLSAAYSTVAGKFDAIKKKISDTITSAKDTVSSMVEKIKGAFDFSWNLPKLKLPHISVTGGEAPYGLGGKGSLPKFSIEWYKSAMNAPKIMNEPTIFGYNSETGKFMGGGDAGSEVVTGTNTLMNMINEAVAENNEAVVYYLQRIMQILADYFPQFLEAMDQEMCMDGVVVARKIAPHVDRELAKIQRIKERGGTK